MKQKQFQFVIFKNSDHFSNQKILLVLILQIVSSYMKFNLQKNLILSKQTFSFDFVTGI